MSKKQIILIIILICLAGGAAGGYLYYKDYLKKHQPNLNVGTAGEAVVTTAPAQVIATEQLAKPRAPQIKDLELDSVGLYPTFSGAYEPIWDDYASEPIEIRASGDSDMSASYKVIWSKKYLYVQIKVLDDTISTDGESYKTQDSVEIFINEDNQRNEILTVGDAHYIINRDNVQTVGSGADPNAESITYPIYSDENNEEVNGYIVEIAIPLLTMKASKNTSIGFDIQVNDAVEGNLICIRKWASDYLYTFQNFTSLGTLTFK